MHLDNRKPGLKDNNKIYKSRKKLNRKKIFNCRCYKLVNKKLFNFKS